MSWAYFDTLSVISEPCKVKNADQQDFEHALLNLLINAKDAIENTSDDNPSITISIKTIERAPTSTVSISISDTGSGIPESEQNKINFGCISSQEPKTFKRDNFTN